MRNPKLTPWLATILVTWSGAVLAQTTYYRSIGTEPDYGTNEVGYGITTQVNVTNGSVIVNGVGSPQWQTANRGRGDRINIDGVDYTILRVTAEDQLLLTSAYAGTTGTYDYTIYRKFATIGGWANCLSNTTVTLPECHDVSDSDLTAAGDDRSEVGIVYNDGPYSTTLEIAINGITDPTHTITLTVDKGLVNNRHEGVPGAGVVIDNNDNSSVVVAYAHYVTVEWLEIVDAGADGIKLKPSHTGSTYYVVRNNLIRYPTATPNEGIDLDSTGGVTDLNADVYNNVISGGRYNIKIDDLDPTITVNILNNTVYNCTLFTPNGCGITSLDTANPGVTVRNNIAHTSPGSPLIRVLSPAASSNNITSDASGEITVANITDMKFVDYANDDFHILATSPAEDAGTEPVGGVIKFDIDGIARVSPWDIGADDIGDPTAVSLIAFEAVGLDGGIALTWATGSEVDNLGFHVYRSTTDSGPYQRITSAIIPGLGSSVGGASYRYVDRETPNGVVHFYKLEDVETTGRTTLHGPVSATPVAGGDEFTDGEGAETRITVGSPDLTRLDVRETGKGDIVLEIFTEGFYARRLEDGTFRLDIPGYEWTEDEPSLPVRRAWVDVLPGGDVKLASVDVLEEEWFEGLTPWFSGTPEVEATSRGTVRAARRRKPRSNPRPVGLHPEVAARLVSVGFQGDARKVFVEIAPLRWDPAQGRLGLARRMVVRLVCPGCDAVDGSGQRRGRVYRRRLSHATRLVAAHLVTVQPGLYGVRFDEVFGMAGHRGVSTSSLRLSRQGEDVAYHLEPDSDWFRPGSTLYFLSKGANANSYGNEAVYELELGAAGRSMPVKAAVPGGPPVSSYWESVKKEADLMYQATLTEAPSRWLWSQLYAPATKAFPFDVSAPAPVDEAARLTVWLQGASDFFEDPDHHVRLYLNGGFIGETSWDGKKPQTLEIDFPLRALVDGVNTLEIENVGDTAAEHSAVLLDRFQVVYPRVPRAVDGALEGMWDTSGTAKIQGLGSGAVLIELGETPSWLTGMKAVPKSLRFRVEGDRSYMAVAPEAVRQVLEVRRPVKSGLKLARNRADYLVIGPRDFIEAAAPLLNLRRSQGLQVKGVAVDEIYTEFGFGERTPVAIRDFLTYAYHQWYVGPRYVLLLGDGTFDYKNHLDTGVENHVPPLLVMTSYLETASDPALAAVNGDDLLPDLAIGRLPAANRDELGRMVSKIVAWETSERSLGNRVVLVVDDPDSGGDFATDAEVLTSTVLSSKELKKLYLSELGAAETRSGIVEAFDEGASIVNYIGHGGIHLWADEDILNIWDLDKFSPQAEQPLLLTMNCLNGYFHFPFFDSLAEGLLKAEDKGAVAAFSPSGLSLNSAAHVFNIALLEQILNGHNPRLGDAVLAAQAVYAGAGAFEEMLTIYHLFGDPAMRIQ